MDERQINWELLGMYKKDKKKYTEARKKIENRDFDFIMQGEGFELDLSDLLAEEEFQAIAEIIDSLFLKEIARCELEAYKVENRLKG